MAARAARRWQASSQQCVLKMADGLCTGVKVSNLIEKTVVKDYDNVIECMNSGRMNDVSCEKVKSFYISSDSDKLFDKLCAVKGSKDDKHEGFLDMEMPCSSGEEDCRKKRCADRYDSSESSDSGVAVLSCTDCSGSSTASSDITDPGSPFSTASSHSEDSASQPAKMPPTQSAHHPPWPWARGESPPMKRHTPDNKTAFPKRIKTDNENASSIKEDQKTVLTEKEENKLPPVFLSSSSNTTNSSQVKCENIINSVTTEVLSVSTNSNSNIKAPSSNLVQSEKLITNKKVIQKCEISAAAKTQGKITEYFKTQMKANGIKKELSNVAIKSNVGKNPNLHKYFSLVGGLKPNASLKTQHQRKIDIRTVHTAVKKVAVSAKSRKLSPVTVPRKILPAPSKVCDKVTVNSINNVNDVNNFTPTVTLTTLALPPNLAYLHTKTPKPPDNFILQQFTTLGSDKINTIPLVSTQCTMIHPLQKIATINNFNCIKLNATVVPIVKLNTLPSKVNGSNFGSVALNVEAGVPTVVPAKSKLNECSVQTSSVSASNGNTPTNANTETVVQNKLRVEEKSPSNSDSGISTELEILVNQKPCVESQKSPILSQPKTIRFPAKQKDNTECKETRNSHSSDASCCRWAECHSQFDTSGALLEHLQIKHVISQATQEQYVCLWLGCKVHGRTSCSRTWLERHVLAHAGTKPFRCIVEGCGMRFNSQLSLERHVNGHFNTDGTQSASANKKSVENGSVKLFKRNGKKIRFRRQPWSARMFDFFDNGIMEGLQHQLLTMTEMRTLGHRDAVPGDTIRLHSEVLARRIESDGNRKILLRWNPPNIIPDEWVHEKDYSSSKIIPIRTLQPNAVNELNPILFPQHSKQLLRHKQRRKPSKCT